METRSSYFGSDEEWAEFVRKDAAQKRAVTHMIARKRAISRTYGIVAIVEGALGLLAAVGLEFWANDVMVTMSRSQGDAYMPVYDVQSVGLVLIAAAFFFVLVAGIGFIKRERWSVYCVLICGMVIFAASVAVALLSHNPAHGANSSVSTVAIVAAAVCAPLIIPPLLPPVIRSTEPKRRRSQPRPHIG